MTLWNAADTITIDGEIYKVVCDAPAKGKGKGKGKSKGKDGGASCKGGGKGTAVGPPIGAARDDLAEKHDKAAK